MEQPEASPKKSMQVYLRCLHCDRNQSRHLRVGIWFRCRYCHELNPGPAVTDKVLAVRRRRVEKAAAPAAESSGGNGGAPPAAVVPSTPARPVRRVRRAGAPAPAVQPAAAGAPVSPPAGASPAPSKPEELTGLKRVLFG